MPPIDLTLIEEMNGMNAVIDYINSFDFKPDDEITIDGETFTVGQLKRKHIAYLAKLAKAKDRDVSW